MLVPNEDVFVYDSEGVDPGSVKVIILPENFVSRVIEAVRVLSDVFV